MKPSLFRIVTSIFLLFSCEQLFPASSKLLRLQIANGNNTDELVILFNPSAANGIDNWDSEKMFASEPTLPQIYAEVAGKKLVIDAMTSIDGSVSLKIGIKILKTGTFTLSATQITDLDAFPVVLEDVLTGKCCDLKSASYTFSSNVVETLDRFVLHFKKLPFVWTGENSTDWTNPLNWNYAQVPSSNDSVIVKTVNSAHTLRIDASSANPAHCKSLDIEQNASMVVPAGKALTVEQYFTNNGSFEIYDDSLLLGSFICKGMLSGGGINKVLMILNGKSSGSEPSGRYWYLTVPFDNLTASCFNIQNGNRLWKFDEATGNYSQITAGSDLLQRGRGYVARLMKNDTLVFSSSNTAAMFSDLMVTLTRTGTSQKYRGYQLIGNPFTSFIDFSAIEKSPDVLGNIWYRTVNQKGEMVFDTYNSLLGIGTGNNGIRPVTGMIAPRQAVWMYVAGDGTTGQHVSERASMLSHNQTQGLKSDNDIRYVRLAISDRRVSDELIIASHREATPEADIYDTRKFEIGKPSIYTSRGDEKFVIDAVGEIDSEAVFPVACECVDGKPFEIEVKEMAGFENMRLELRDLKKNITTSLTCQTKYGFECDQAFRNRFEISLKSSTQDVSVVNQTQVTIKRVGGKLYIDSDDENIIVNVSTLEGKQLIHFDTLVHLVDVSNYDHLPLVVTLIGNKGVYGKIVW